MGRRLFRHAQQIAVGNQDGRGPVTSARIGLWQLVHIDHGVIVGRLSDRSASSRFARIVVVLTQPSRVRKTSGKAVGGVEPAAQLTINTAQPHASISRAIAIHARIAL